MIKMTLPRIFAASSLLYSLSLLSSQVAVGQTETDLLAKELPTETKAETLEATRAEAQAAEASQTVASQTFKSDGGAVSLENLGVTITPPAGWEVSTNTGSLSVVMSEPRQEAPAYEKPKYQRNITVAAMHQASPIDEKRAEQLKAEMIKTFGADPLVSNFQVIEHKFFNYRGKNDGLLVYSSLSIGEYPMMQMHVLVSGQAKQFLLTYTDMADRFSDQKDGSYEAAWNSIVSIEVTGASPNRYEAYMRYGAGVGGFLMLGLALLLIRRRATRFDYGSEADAMIEADDSVSGMATSVFSTLAGGWKLDDKDGSDFAMSGMEFQAEAAGGMGAPRTRRTEYVSNY